MDLMDLALMVGLVPRKSSLIHGGEYHSSCPACGGKDRFWIQPNKQMKNCRGRYKCRKCGRGGDTIKFAMEFNGMTFPEALKSLDIKVDDNYRGRPLVKIDPKPSLKVHKIARKWQRKATEFVLGAHRNIFDEQESLDWLCSRGLPLEAVKQYKIGWNNSDCRLERSSWNLPVDGENNKLWLPRGIVIPLLNQNGLVERLKVRRVSWHPGDKVGKYINIPGSMGGCGLIGDVKKKIAAVVESELDALAIHFACSDFLFVVAVGSNIKNPDAITNLCIRDANEVLLCHDNDSGGTVMLEKWKKRYKKVKSFPTPVGKDIGEAIEGGLCLRWWLLGALSRLDRNVVIKSSWPSSDKDLIEFVLDYINKRTVTRKAYEWIEREIILGPESPRAKSGELRDGLMLMRKLILEETKGVK